MGQWVMVKVENGRSDVTGNVDIPGRIALLRAGEWTIFMDIMKPIAKDEGRPPEGVVPAQSAKTPVTFAGRQVA